MKRREFIALAGSALAFPRVALWQQAAKVPPVAWLSIPVSQQNTQALVLGLADNGFTDGKDVIIDLYTAPTNADLPAFAAKASANAPAVMVTFGTVASQAAKAATSSIPIVFVSVADPVGI